MRILVTGGAGFIGSHVAEACLAEGHEVTVLDDLSSGRRKNVPDAARFVRMDLRDPALDALLRNLRPEVVCHHAAQASVQRSMQDPVLDAQVNLLGSLELLAACERRGVRKLIYVSTAAVYGEPETLPVPESHPKRPLSGYGASKLAFEHYLRIQAPAAGLDYSILRYANVYGPRQDPLGEAGVVATFGARLLAGQACTIHGDGEQSRDFVYVADCAQANLKVLGEAGAGATYNIGSGQLTSVNALYRRMAHVAGVSRPALHGPPKAGEIYQLVLDPARIQAELGWRPQFELEAGLGATLDSLREPPPTIGTLRLDLGRTV